MTPGLIKAITKNGTRKVCSCGMAIPAYPGRYPRNCPLCGKPLTDPPDPNAQGPDDDADADPEVQE